MSQSNDALLRYRQGSLYLAAALACGIAAAPAVGARPAGTLAVLASLVAAALTLAAVRRPALSVAALLASVAALGAYAASLSSVARPDSIAGIVRRASGEGPALLTFRGVLLERTLDGRHRLSGNSRYRLRLQSVETSYGPESCSGDALLDVPSRDLPYGAVVDGAAEFRLPAPPANPGQFDYRAWLERDGIGCLAKAPHEGLIRVVGPAPGHAVGRAFDSVRAGLLAHMEDLQLTESGVIPAIIVGETSGLAQDTRDAFIRSGTMHLLSISGLHVAIVAGLFLALLRLAGVPLKPASYAAIAVAAAYAVLVGAGPPVVRSVIMFALFCLGVIVSRRAFALSIVSTTVFVMLVVRPMDLYDVGFQLSLAGVLGIIYLGAPLARAMSALTERSKAPLAGVLSHVASGVGYSVGAGLAVAPLTLYHFKVVSFVSPLANLIHIPITWAMLVSGMLAAGVSFVSAKAAVPFALSAAGSEMALVETAKLIARIPLAYAYVPAPPPLVIFASYAALAIGAILASVKARALPIAISGLVAANAIVLVMLLPARSTPPEVVSLTDGRGAAAVAFDGQGHSVLFLGGSGDAFLATQVICPFFLERGSSRIDLIVESAGADVRMRDAILDRLTVGRIVRQQRWASSGDGEDSDAALAGVTQVSPGGVIEGPGRMRVTCHFPEPQDYLGPPKPYFKGLIADVAFGERRAVILLDASDGCLAVAGRQIPARPDLLVIVSRSGEVDLLHKWELSLSPAKTVTALSRQKGDNPASISTILADFPQITAYNPD